MPNNARQEDAGLNGTRIRVIYLAIRISHIRMAAAGLKGKVTPQRVAKNERGEALLSGWKKWRRNAGIPHTRLIRDAWARRVATGGCEDIKRRERSNSHAVSRTIGRHIGREPTHHPLCEGPLKFEHRWYDIRFRRIAGQWGM